jgi:hypothetical protein
MAKADRVFSTPRITAPKIEPQKSARVSGKLIGKMLEDLCRRLQDQVNIAEALEAAARPHSDVTVCEYPMLKVLELAAAQHAAELRQVTGLAKIISERRPS